MLTYRYSRQGLGNSSRTDHVFNCSEGELVLLYIA